MNLNQITVPSVGLSKSVAFYQKLGLRLIVGALPYYARFECPEDDATFSIHRVEELPEGDGIYVYFECAGLDERVTRLRATGIVFNELPTDQR
ncbi:VOC family protein [Tunicatimonas pelagia]|uniref:VOC family protein n=1 Tax=Tunicatimonas pelagia TaxID=931531 RepID=UPI0026670AF3|nr:VOC family protein [Tunicatimonas pelagia]WKN45017.1 VOC family protein [Tunicatimonas pelagia]